MFNSDDSAYLSYRFICAEKRKITQTLNVDVNSSTTENAHTGTGEHSSRIKI